MKGAVNFQLGIAKTMVLENHIKFGTDPIAQKEIVLVAYGKGPKRSSNKDTCSVFYDFAIIEL